uniref:Uncharacterized protein n=1 Tax=Fagus sylvatica TaxID=28930 RepID=A0A2N9FNI6_FAGSY
MNSCSLSWASYCSSASEFRPNEESDGRKGASPSRTAPAQHHVPLAPPSAQRRTPIAPLPAQCCTPIAPLPAQRCALLTPPPAQRRAPLAPCLRDNQTTASNHRRSPDLIVHSPQSRSGPRLSFKLGFLSEHKSPLGLGFIGECGSLWFGFTG